eukprot:5874420-Pleurochrysis_carterae.AAC.1
MGYPYYMYSLVISDCEKTRVEEQHHAHYPEEKDAGGGEAAFKDHLMQLARNDTWCRPLNES